MIDRPTPGTTLPRRISRLLAWLARSRSHVFQRCSAKNEKPTKDTRKKANIVDIAGTVYSLPLAVGSVRCRARRASGLKNAIITIGIKVRVRNEAASDRRTRTSWRMIAALREGIDGLFLFEAASGDGAVDGLQAGVQHLDAGERRVVGGAEGGERVGGSGGRVVAGDAQPGAVDDGAGEGCEVGRRSVELELDRRPGVGGEQLGQRAPADDLPLLEDGNGGVELLDLGEVVGGVADGGAVDVRKSSHELE